jgi:hypothetical protein
VTYPGRSRAERLALGLANPTTNPAEQDARRVFRETKGDDPRPALQTILERLGHRGVVVEQTVAGTRWFSWCECGWVSTTRNTEQDAAGAAVHHSRLVLREYRTRALPLSAYPAEPPATDWEKVRRRNRHWALKRAEEGTEPEPRHGVSPLSESDSPRHAAG